MGDLVWVRIFFSRKVTSGDNFFPHLPQKPPPPPAPSYSIFFFFACCLFRPRKPIETPGKS